MPVLTPDLITFIVSLCATSIAGTKYLNNSIEGIRRQLDDRLDAVILQLKDTDRNYQLKDIKFEQDILRLESYCNGNKELIAHRSGRLDTQIGKLDSRVSQIEIDLHNRLRAIELAMQAGATNAKTSA
jgi:hypothetical protein